MFKRVRRVILILIAANFGLILIFGIVALAMGEMNWPWNEDVSNFCLRHAPTTQSVLVDAQERTFKLFSQPDLVSCAWDEAGRTVVTTFGSWPQTLVQTSLMYLVIWAQYSAVALVFVALASALVWAFRTIGQWSGNRSNRK